jgi:hypothetical protein
MFPTLKRAMPTLNRLCFFWCSNISFVWNSQQTQMLCMGQWISSWCYWTWAQNRFNGPFCLEEPAEVSWNVSGYRGEHCFASYPYGSSFPVRRCTTHWTNCAFGLYPSSGVNETPDDG